MSFGSDSVRDSYMMIVIIFMVVVLYNDIERGVDNVVDCSGCGYIVMMVVAMMAVWNTAL